MTLARFFEDIAPVLLGRVPVAESRLDLRSPDRERLPIYSRFSRNHRFEVIEGVFACCNAEVVDRLGQEAWEKLVEAYFVQHPMLHVELNANGAQWPDYLASQSVVPVPPWLAALADFEWWEWQMSSAHDGEQSNPDAGPLRFAPTIELRPYAYDLVSWIEDDCVDDPVAQATFVLFWRDRELQAQRDNVEAVELLVLRSIATGEAITDGVLTQVGATREDVEEVIVDLHSAGALLGHAQ